MEVKEENNIEVDSKVFKYGESHQKSETIEIFVDDDKNINIVKKEFSNEYFELDDDWKPEIIELRDSDHNSQKIENFLEKVVRKKIK